LFLFKKINNKIKSCSHFQTCDHKYVEANKFLKNKIDEMFIKCEHSVHGCIKTDKVCEIGKHEKNCQFRKFTCHYAECMKETGKGEMKNHKESCPFSNYACIDGCGKTIKLFEVKFILF